MTAIKTSLKASLIATAIATLPFSAHAAGLGGISVLSGLGQPLRAEIELNATSQELESLSARIASADAFRQANLPYSPLMAALRLAVEKRGSGAVVRISSDRPLNDPFVDLLLELDWASGRLIREYTFLLDPVQLNAPAPVAAQVMAPAVSSTTPARPRPSVPSSAQTVTESASDRYAVRRGDTLHSVAESHRPPSASLDQMLIALFRDNPEAFDGGNINRLRAGVILNVPAEQEVLSVEPVQARREVLAQSADFEAYRKRLAGASAARAASVEPESSRADAGTIVPKIDEGARPDSNGDRVKVSAAADSAGAQATDEGARVARLQALEEELVARDKALEEANTRLAALEASIREMQQLLELRNQGLGQLQQQATPATAPVAVNPPATPTPADAPTAEIDRQTAGVQPAPQAKTSAAPTPAATQDEPPGFLGEMLQDPKMLAGGGGILVLLLGYAGLKARERRNGAAASADGQGARLELPPVTNSVFGATGGQNVNTSDTSIIHTDFSQSGLSAIDADEGVDPVAEADVYMAYGRDAQAEEILLDALKADSARPAIFLKLLEIYEQRKNLKQFETTASDFYARTGGEGSDWQRAAEMGRRIDPANPLYGASVVRAAGAATETGVLRSAPGCRSLSETAPGLAVLATAAAATPEADDTRLGSARPDLDFTSAADTAVDLRSTDGFGALDGDSTALQIDSLDMPTTVGGRSSDPEPVIEALPEIDAAALDFDLDAGLGLDVEFPGLGDAPDAAPEIGAPALHDVVAEGFELDLDIADASAPAVASMNETVIGDGSDFARPDQSLEFDLNAEAAHEERESLLAGFDLDGAGAAEKLSPAARRDDGVADLEKTTFDSSLLDFDFNLEDATPMSAEEPAAFDLSNIALDLEPGSADEGGQTETPIEALDISTELPPVAVAELNEDALQEVDTKLELARAYDEMGDKDGARELIEEVLREGSADQQAAGRRLLERLA